MPILTITNLIFLTVLKTTFNINFLPFFLISFLGITIASILDILNYIIFRKENIKVQKKFTKRIDGLLASIYRGLIEIGTLPYKAWITLKAIIKTIYRMKISKSHLLEWTTAEEAEKKNKNDIISIYKNMIPNIIFGVLGIAFSFIIKTSPLIFLLSLFFILMPFLMWYISKPNKERKTYENLNKKELEYIKDIAKKTWNFFLQYMAKEENFLPPDNYQENRREKIVHRTSSTNIGLGLVTIIAAYDLKFIELDKALSLLENMIATITKLEKWNGHLYNWYNTLNLKPLTPRYISTVDSGNFVRLYVYNKSVFSRKGKYTV